MCLSVSVCAYTVSYFVQVTNTYIGSSRRLASKLHTYDVCTHNCRNWTFKTHFFCLYTEVKKNVHLNSLGPSYSHARICVRTFVRHFRSAIFLYFHTKLQYAKRFFVYNFEFPGVKFLCLSKFLVKLTMQLLCG